MKKVLISISLFLLLPSFILASNHQSGGTGGTGSTNPTGPVEVHAKFTNPFNVGHDNLYDLAKAIVDNIILPIGGTLCVLAFIYAGFKYVTAQGKPTAISEANKTLLYAAIGTAVLLGSWVIANVIDTTIKAIAS